MKILTWNIRHGGGTRVNEILEVLSGKYAETAIVVMSEFRSNTQGGRIRQHLKKAGYVYQFAPEAGEKTNTVLVASRLELNFSVYPRLGIHSHRVVGAEGTDFQVYACYFPQQDEKKQVFEFLLQEIQDGPDKPVIITGDINTGKHYIDEEGATFFHSAYLEKLEATGMLDAFRHFHPDAREYSWYSNRAKNGFRIDHFFVSANLKDRVFSCLYSHEEREKKISDHSVMMLEIN
ncbi:MAG: endonuclease/exonuclease/phosphatase family protein [Bacteroidia bacterium]|nr:endonuclease/exonuclease/phosphatase family protein [Bacteroidia bacterium]